MLHLNLPLGVTNEGREAIKLISGAVAGDSSLQDRGVAHYLLSLLFSLVSLPFSFYLCVLYQKTQKIVCLVPCLPSMPNFFETRSYWHGGFTKDQQDYYKEHHLSQKGIHLWKQIHQLYEYARNLCSIYNIYLSVGMILVAL